nr:hypothetical protein [Tanacetum cinerariifolium]
MLNPTPDAGMESIFEMTSQMDVQTPTSMASLPFVGAVSSILGIVHRYMDQRMNEAVKVAVQLQSDRLRDEAQKENGEFLKTIDENMQKIIKDQVKEQVKGKLYKALVEAYESDKIILDTYGDTVTLKRRRDDDMDKDKEPSARSDRGSKRRGEGKELESASALKEKATRSAGNELAKQSDSRSSFNELMDTPVDFSAFLMNRLKVDTFTSELLAGPTYELMKGSCKSLVELKFFLEEVYKATTDQLDWVNPEGQQYPHNLLKLLPLIPNSQGRHVIPFDHFINKDLEYLRGGASSRKYTTFGISHWGRKRQQFYGFAINRESARDVYSKRRIIVVTELNIVKWHNYKHLDWIMVRRDDDKLYKFKEGDFKRLRIQDIEDMLLLLVQGKLTNLTVEERFAFNNRLMRIDELHKFSDGMLTDVRTALDDCLKGIQMKYLPQSIWRKSDKDRAAAMIQAIDKRLNTRRIMSSLERFVGGRLYEGDFRMLQDHMIYRMLSLSFKRTLKDGGEDTLKSELEELEELEDV